MAKNNYSEIKVAAARTAFFNNIENVDEEINIHQVLKLSSGINLPTYQMIDGDFPVFGGGGQTNLTHNSFNVGFETLAIGRVGARCGCVFKVPKQSWVTDNALYALNFDERFDLTYLIHYLNYVDLNQYANRAAQPVISLKRIALINFPLISKERQIELVDIINQIEGGRTDFGCDYIDLDNSLKSVDNINLLQLELSSQLTQIENLSQAILQEAVQGKLVAQNKNDEPANELLKRIKAEKAKSGKKEKPLPPIKPEEIPFEIPESWVWCRLGEVCDKIGSGSTPRGSNYSKDGFPFFRSQNVYNEGLIYDDIKFVSDEVQKQMNGTVVLPNDILLNITGGSMGRCALVPDDFEEGNVSQHVCIIRPLQVDRNYFHKIVLSPYFQKFIFSSTTGAGREGLPKYNLERFVIPLPPLPEQKRIVAEIEKQLAKTKQLKEHIIANQQATEQLLKALLHGAFEVEEIEEVNI